MKTAARCLFATILVLAGTTTANACFFPFFPTYSAGYGGGWGPYAPAPAAWAPGYRTVGFRSPFYFGAPYTVSYGVVASGCDCPVACCDPCASGCADGSCGGVGTMRPVADPVSSTRQKEDAPDSSETEPVRTYDGSTPDDTETSKDVQPFDGFEAPANTSDAGAEGPDWTKSGTGGAAAGDRTGTSSEVDDILQNFPAPFTEQSSQRPPITNPVEGVDKATEATDETPNDTTPGEADGSKPESQQQTLRIPNESLGTEVDLKEFLSPADDTDRVLLDMRTLTHTDRRSSHAEVIGVARLAVKRNSVAEDSRISSTRTVPEKSLQWISVPMPAGRIRL